MVRCQIILSLHRIFLGLSLVLILLMLLLTIVECIMDERSNTDYGVNGRGGAVPPPNTDYGTYNRPSRQYDEPRFQTPPPRVRTYILKVYL